MYIEFSDKIFINIAFIKFKDFLFTPFCNALLMLA